jgi:hypothetical protein
VGFLCLGRRAAAMHLQLAVLASGVSAGDGRNSRIGVKDPSPRVVITDGLRDRRHGPQPWPTSLRPEVTWKDGPLTYRTWVWASAVTRCGEAMSRNLGKRVNRDNNNE